MLEKKKMNKKKNSRENKKEAFSFELWDTSDYDILQQGG